MIGIEDRVLVVGVAQCGDLAGYARRCQLLVGIGTEAEVRAARRECAHLDNVMFTAGDRESIPWREEFFTVILDADGGEATEAMRRVLTPGGRILTL